MGDKLAVPKVEPQNSSKPDGFTLVYSSRWLLSSTGSAVAAEFLGTFLFVLIGIGAVTSGCHLPDVLNASGNAGNPALDRATKGSCTLQSVNVLNISLAFSFGLLVAIYSTAAISGGHLNPAVTFACLISGRISLLRAAFYMGFQCLGALLSAAVVKGIDTDGFRAAGGAANAVNTKNGMSPLSAWGAEAILTFALVFIVFAATDSERGLQTPHLAVLAPLTIGLVVLGAHFFAIPIDGCSLNPARSFGPAAMAGAWKDHWVFWAGPLTGAAVAFFVFDLIFRHQIVAESLPDAEKQVPGDHIGVPRGSETILNTTSIQLAEQGSNVDPSYGTMEGSDVEDLMSSAALAAGKSQQARRHLEAKIIGRPVDQAGVQEVSPSAMLPEERSQSKAAKGVHWPQGSPTSVQEWRRTNLTSNAARRRVGDD